MGVRRWRRLFALWWVIALCLPAPVLAQDPDSQAISLEEYRTVLAEVHALLAQPDAGEPALDEARARLSTASGVTLANGEQVSLRSLLGGHDEPLALADALARVDLVIGQLEATPRDDAAAREAALQRVLNDPNFDTESSLMQRILRWLNEWLGERMPDPQPRTSAPVPGGMDFIEIIVRIVGLIGGVAVLGLLVYLLRGLLEDFVPDFRLSSGAEAEDAWPQTPQAARTRATRFAESGDFRQAVRQLYLSALLTLEERGLVAADRSLTNREVLARVPKGHPVRPHLQPVVDTFDEVWYGMHEPDAASFASYGDSIDALSKVVTREKE